MNSCLILRHLLIADILLYPWEPKLHNSHERGKGNRLHRNGCCLLILVELALVPLMHRALLSHPLVSSGDVLYCVRERLLTETQASCFPIFWVPHEPCRVECRALALPGHTRLGSLPPLNALFAEPVCWESTLKKEFSLLFLSEVVLFVSSSRGCLVNLVLCNALTPRRSCLSCLTLWSVSAFLMLSRLCSAPEVLAILVFLWHHWAESSTLGPLSGFYFHPIYFIFPCAWVKGQAFLFRARLKGKSSRFSSWSWMPTGLQVEWSFEEDQM